jgi:hypothetical protein
MPMEQVKMIGCRGILDSLKQAVRDYNVKEVCQTDLKPLSVLFLSELYTRIYGERFIDSYLYVNCMKKDKDREWVIRTVKRKCRLKPLDYECVVDFNIMRGEKDPYVSLMTAESEAYSPEATALSRSIDDESNDMMWDLFKLLHYPSPLRFFVTLSSVKHHKTLLKKTSQKIALYSKLLIGADIFAVQVPTGRLSKHDCTVAHWSGKYPKMKMETLKDKIRDPVSA